MADTKLSALTDVGTPGGTDLLYIVSAGASFSTTVAGVLATFTGSSAVVTLGTVVTGVWHGTAVDVAHGGTGAATFTSHGIMLGQGTSAMHVTAAMTDGQLLVGQTGADPTANTVSGSGATITLGATGVITISAIANASLSNASVTVTAGTGLSGGGAVALGAAVTLSLPSVGTAGTYEQVTTDAQGRVSSGSAQQGKGTLTTDTDASTVTFDLATSNRHQVVLTASRTLALSNPSTGQTFLIRLVQGGSGSNTVTWFTTIKWPGGTPPTLTTTNGKTDVFAFLCTGSNTYDAFIVGQNL